MIRQLKGLIKSSKLDDILKHKTIKPFADVLRPLIVSIKLKPSQRPKDYMPTIIDKLCGDINSSETNKLLLETFFKNAAFRAIFNLFFEKLISKGYTPNKKRAETKPRAKNTKKGDKAEDLPTRVHASNEEKI